MSFPNSSTLGRGQLRCFKCRKTCQGKDGTWRDQNHQQVFVCKACEATERKPPATGAAGGSHR